MSGRSSRALEAALLWGGALASAAAPTGCAREGSASRRGEPVRVAAAADLAGAFREMGEAFERETGKKVSFSFGSTGLLAKQIEQGAPFDVFAAANASYVDDVVGRGACWSETRRRYAEGRLVLWSKDAARAPRSLADLRDARFAKVAIANPEHAPYGRAARQALERSGVWSGAEGAGGVEARAVYGENVQQAMMFAQTGNAEVAIVALAVAIGQPGSYVPIDPSLHERLDQQMVLCKGGPGGGKPNEGRAFMDFVSSPSGRAIMSRYGFVLPGE